MNFLSCLLFTDHSCFHSWMQFPASLFAIASCPSSGWPGGSEAQVWREREQIQQFCWYQLIKRRDWHLLRKGSGNKRCQARRRCQRKVFHGTIWLWSWELLVLEWLMELLMEMSIDGEGKVSTQAKDQLQPEYILRGTCVAHKLYCCKAWADTRK